MNETVVVTDDTGVTPEDAPPTQTPTYVNPRELLYAQIAEKREATAPVAEPELVVKEDLVVEVESEPEPESPVYLKDGEWYTKRKVNGEDEEVKYNELLEINQKVAAADRTMEEAAEQRQVVQQEQQQLQAREQAFAQAQHRMEQQQPQPADLKELSHKYNEALMNDDMETADRLLVELQAASARKAISATINPERIKEAAVIEVKQGGWNKDLQAANRWLADENSEISGDPQLKGMAQRNAERILGERVAEGQKTWQGFSVLDVSPLEVYQDAVTQTKDWLTARANAATSSQETRVERKRQVSGKAVTGATARADLGKNEKVPMTNAQKIAQMRKARGQAV